MQPENSYRITPSVRHSGIVNCVIQSINQDISNAPANKISRWRAQQTMDEIKKKMKR